MLNDLFIQSDTYYLDLHRKYIDHFTDVIIFFVFLISINTSCWEEAL